MIYVFFFKQKTAYEMRISDWSSDVCSSDLSNAARLVRLINDILDIEKIEAGRMQFDLRPLPLGPLLEAAEHQTAGFASEYGVSVLVEPVAASAAVLADEVRLMQVGTNQNGRESCRERVCTYV